MLFPNKLAIDNPTTEQLDIIKAVGTGDNILVGALAGTGKTSTLLMVAHQYPKRKGLYLAYNKTMQLEAKQKFPRHIICKTVHGLAYEKIGTSFSAQLSKKVHTSFIVDYMDIHPLKEGKYFASPELLAASARDMVNIFSYSTDKNIEPHHYSRRSIERLTDKYKDLDFDLEQIESPKTFLEHFIAESWNIATGLWVAMSDVDNELIPANHDTYLKLYQLSRPNIQGYDYIMLDEAQDANPAILDILSHQKVQRIYIGDEYQQIYGFRGSINAMNSIKGKTYYLTQSFRFGEAIAQEANKILLDLKAKSYLKGYQEVQSKISSVNKNLPYAFISRTNAALFSTIIKMGEEGRKIHFVGDMNKVINLFESAYFLYKNEKNLIKDASLKRFQSWDKFTYEANLSGDHEYISMIKFVAEHQDKVPEVLKVIKNFCSYKEKEAEIVMTTAHKAKGKQWTQVHLNDDFLLDRSIEEMNIYYVALTRAVHVLSLENQFDEKGQKLLTIELVPETCWFSNVRSNVKKIDWEKLKTLTFRKASYRCEICNKRGEKWPVECHEIWEYNDIHKIQTLKGLISLCPPCHQVKHIGFANVQGAGEAAALHLSQVNDWDMATTYKYIDEQFLIWQERSKHEWSLDVSWLKDFGITIKDKILDRDKSEEIFLMSPDVLSTIKEDISLNFNEADDNDQKFKLLPGFSGDGVPRRRDHYVLEHKNYGQPLIPTESYPNPAAPLNTEDPAIIASKLTHKPIKIKYGFCKMCDSRIQNEWTFGDKYCLHHLVYQGILKENELKILIKYLENNQLDNHWDTDVRIENSQLNNNYGRYLINVSKNVLISTIKYFKLFFRKVYVRRTLANRKLWKISARGNFYNPVFQATVYPYAGKWNIARFNIHYSGYDSKNSAQKNSFRMWLNDKRANRPKINQILQ